MFLVHSVDGFVAWFIDTGVKSISVEEFALILTRIREISSIEKSIRFGSRRSSLNFVINARVVIS